MSSRIASNAKTRKPLEDATKEEKIKRVANTDRTNIKTNAALKSKIAPTRSTINKSLTKTSSTDSKSSLDSYKSPLAKPLTSKNSMKPVVKKSTAEATSSRIKTTQYYPNQQQIIKNVLKSEGITVNKSVPMKLSQKKVANVHRVKRFDGQNSKTPKIAKDSDHSSDNSVGVTSDRPGTATLAKGFIVNDNIAGPDAPQLDKGHIVLSEEMLRKSAAQGNVIEDVKIVTGNENNVLKISPKQGKSSSDEENYEDDFDSYASDFEEYHSSSQASSTSSNVAANLPTDGAITSSSSSEDISITHDATKRVFLSDEEKKLDSGNFDLPEYKHKHLLDNIHEDNECSTSLKGQTNAMSSLSDEGFEDGRAIRSPSTTFIDFHKVKLQIEKRRSIEQGKTRGEEILEMIKLDLQSFVILDMSPISYEAFIKSFGNRTSCQVTCQTGEDSQSEETQTDTIIKQEKWIQYPIKFTKALNDSENYVQIFKAEMLGVGTDIISEEKYKLVYSEVKLIEFMKNTSKLILTLFDEAKKSTAKNIEINSDNVPFSSGFITLNTKYKDFLKGRHVTNILFSNKTNSKLLSVHSQINNGTCNNTVMECRCLICVWDINSADKPEHVLSCFGDIRSCCFHIENPSVILAGLTDGSITMWDTNNISLNKLVDYPSQFSMILSCYTSDVNSDVNSPVIFIQASYDVIDVINSTYERNSVQIYTINEDSTLRIWGFIKVVEDHWNFNYTLIQNQKIYLADIYPELNDVQCLTATMSILDPNHLFISTNYGYIIHCLTTKAKANPKKFTKISDEISLVTSLASCPYAPFHFLAATSAGSTVIYSRTLARPLMAFKYHSDSNHSSIDNGNEKIMCRVQWSFTRPCRFYTLSPNGKILHCWNLAYSDMVPESSAGFEWNMTGIALSPLCADKSTGHNTGRCYMAISSEDNILLHILNENHGVQSLINYHNDVKLFMNYINRFSMANIDNRTLWLGNVINTKQQPSYHHHQTVKAFTDKYVPPLVSYMDFKSDQPIKI